MRVLRALVAGVLISACHSAAQTANVRTAAHASEALGETRAYRVFLPAGYADSGKRYPVVYWFHGDNERFDSEDRALADYLAAHELIVIKPDGSNTLPGNRKGRVWNVSEVESGRQFPLYFPELVEHVDSTLRTRPDRAARAVTGVGSGGFLAYWIAGKYPDAVGSASSMDGAPEAFAGPKGFEVEYRHDDLYRNYDGVRTMLLTHSGAATRFYQRRLNAVWSQALDHHETAAAGDRAEAVTRVLDFHLSAFAAPLAKPAEFSHADVYPNFSCWGWNVTSSRRQPGFTAMENVSATGFRSAVREWLPGGAAMPGVKLSIASAPLYKPGSSHVITYFRLRDGLTRRLTGKADAEGRLEFELDGEAYEVGISNAGVIAIAGVEIASGGWAEAGRAAELRVRFINKGSALSKAAPVKWESPNEGVTIRAELNRIVALAPGETVTAPVTFTAADPARVIARLVAVVGENRLSFEVPLFPPAKQEQRFLISDGHTVNTYTRAIERTEATLGEGNRDGHAAPGESFAVLFPEEDANWMRAAELFTSDPCVDNSVRISDSWNAYDGSGASAKISAPAIRPDCEPGHIVRMLARILLPNAPDHKVEYRAIEFPVWYRNQPR